MKTVSVPTDWLNEINGRTVAHAIAYLSNLRSDHELSYWQSGGDDHGAEISSELTYQRPYTEQEQPATPEPVLFIHPDTFAMNNAHVGAWKPGHELTGYIPLYTHPAPERVPMTERELELIDGMIAVQLDHAQRCDAISNRDMAEKQKGWDMERVELLRRIRYFGITAQARKEGA